MTNKVKTVAEVVQTIPDGSHIALGGFAINRGCIAVAHELIRQQKKNLTLSQGVVGLDTGSAAKDVQRMKCPFTGEEYLLLRALNSDVSFVHVQVADYDGNSQIHGARWENEEQAKAGRRVIVITEELVPTEYIQRFPEKTIIPAHRVEAVIHQPFGAHPTAVFQCYDFDADHLRLYVNHAKRAATFPEYVKTYISDTKDHWEYLEKVGGLRRMDKLKADRILGY